MSVSDLAKRVQKITDELTILKSNASDSYDKFINAQTGNSDTTSQAMIKDFGEKASMYNRLFQEKEAMNQQTGVKGRKQTLQEYVILLFFVSYFILAVSIALYMTYTQGYSSGIQSFVMLLVMIIPIGLLIIRYA